MANFNTIQTSFSSGMVSSKLNGRTDLSLYKDSAEEMLNMYPTNEGGARTREPFKLASLDLAKQVGSGPFYTIDNSALIPVKDARGESYLIHFKTSSGYADTYEYDILYFNESLGIWQTFSSGGATIKNIHLAKFQWCYVGDAIVITTGTTRPLVIYRVVTTFTTWKVSFLDEYVVDKNDGVTKTALNDAMIAMHYPAGEKNTNKNYLLTATLVSGSTYDLVYKNAAGTTLAVWNTALTTYITVTAAAYTAVFKTLGGDAGNTTSLMKATLVYSYGTVAVTNVRDWYIAPWDNINGYPKTCAYFDGRLFLGGTDKFPSSIWCSRSDTIYRFHQLKFVEDASADVSGLDTFSDGVSDTTAFVISTGSTGSFCAIKWIHPGVNGMYVGTSGGVELHNSGSNGAFKLNNTTAQLLTSEGCLDIQPTVFSGAIVYITKDGRRISLLKTDGSAIDLSTLFSSELFKESPTDEIIKRIVANDSNTTISCITTYGRIFGIRLNTVDSKWGMFKISTPVLQDPINSTLAKNADIAMVEEEIRSLLFVYAQDTTTGAQLIKQDQHSESATKTVANAILDSSLVYPPSAISGKIITLQGGIHASAPHKIGVAYLATDNTLNYEEFASGTFTTTITVTKNISSAKVGFPFQQRIKTLDLDLGGSGGNTGITQIKRIDEVGFRLWNTERFKFGMLSTALEEVNLLSGTTLYSGAIAKKIQSSPERGNNLIIQVDTPTQVYISALVYKGLTAE